MTLVKSDRGSGYFQSYIKQRIENNKNFLACITGPTGSGKSWSALRLAQSLDPDFNADNICFSAKQFMNLINGKTKQLKKGSNIVFDEIQVTLGHLDFQSLQAKLLNYVLQTFRHKNFVLWVTSPHFSFINASARKLFHARLETVSINQDAKQVTVKPFLLQVNQSSGEIYAKYLRVWKKEAGVAPLKTLRVGMPSKALLEAYEAKKTAFTQELNESIIRDLEKLEEGNDAKKPLTDIQREIVEDLVTGLTVPQIADKRAIDQRVVYYHLKLIRKKGVEIKPKKLAGNKVIGYEVTGYDGL